MARQKQPKAVDQMTAAQFDALFRTEEDCTAYLIVRRWPQGVICPRCGNPKVYPLASGHHWQCTQCAPGGSAGYRFSHLAGTIFENTKQASQGLVSRHSPDACQQEGNERTANLSVYGLRLL
jgi:ribosomal protein L37AE/L43A